LTPQIAIITDDPGWHGKELTAALQNHGLGSHYLSLIDCLFLFDDSETMIRLPGFESCLPIGVFVRGIPGGTLEQVIFRLDILHALGNLGIVVYNDSRAIERTVDKAMTTLLLKQAGLPTPPTWVFESAEHARLVCQREIQSGYSLVLKPLFGSQGQGVHLINNDQVLVHDEQFAGLYYLQRFIEPSGPDWADIRIFVIGGKAIAAMRRRSSNWITNRAQGARCEYLPLSTQMSQLAEAAAVAINIDYAGVDLISDRKGNLQVIEVNGVPAWWGLQGVTDFNIAQCLIDHFVKRIGENHALTQMS
jgi:tetrahydromethanopterin:alpha-L-glutamate ligase